MGLCEAQYRKEKHGKPDPTVMFEINLPYISIYISDWTSNRVAERRIKIDDCIRLMDYVPKLR